jgi:hypothetical protein
MIKITIFMNIIIYVIGAIFGIMLVANSFIQETFKDGMIMFTIGSILIMITVALLVNVYLYIDKNR